MEYPNEVVARAEFEIDIFDRPSVNTSLDLIRTIKQLRKVVAQYEKAAGQSVVTLPIKPLSPFPQIMESLMHLRDELWRNTCKEGSKPGKESAELEILFKLNSCLYGKYPK